MVVTLPREYLFKILSKGIEILRLDCAAGFELDVGRPVAIGEETPTDPIEQLVDFYPG